MNIRLAMLLLAAVFSVSSLSPNAALASTVPEQKDEAAQLYDNGEYKSAYKQYLKLAKDGDTFAQYRVSFMRLTGLGTKEKVSEAMAWAVLASQSGDAELQKYRDTVAAMVPADKRKSTERKATNYVRRYGSEDALDDAAPVGATGLECTGSRLMRNCKSQARSTTIHISWGKDRSGEPEPLDRIDTLDQEIIEHFSGHQAPDGNS
jgi:hypothetical protein